jgi:hypothetical protein
MLTHHDMNCNHREHFTILITHHLCARSRVPVSTTWALVARRLLKFAHYGQESDVVIIEDLVDVTFGGIF